MNLLAGKQKIFETLVFFAWQHNIFQLDHFYIIKIMCNGQQSFDQFDQSATTANYFQLQGHKGNQGSIYVWSLCANLLLMKNYSVTILIRVFKPFSSRNLHIPHNSRFSSQYEIFAVYFCFVSVSSQFALLLTCIFH